jgi:hypothetical protein
VQSLLLIKSLSTLLRGANVLISTNNNLASDICSQHFGLEAKAVPLIRDEDPKELESMV